jgi:redox-sensing transcriptional repressor
MSTKAYSMQMIRRLPKYYAIIEQALKAGNTQISSAAIAEHLNLEPIVVRKDLEQIGAEGKPRLGFDTRELMGRVEEFMGWHTNNQLVLVGCGSLGSALMGYFGFTQRGFEIVAGFDVDENKIGTFIHDKKVFPLTKLQNLCERMHIDLGIITVPADQAQMVADLMIKSGIRGIWNFSPAAIKVPKEVIVQQEDLLTSLVILQKHLEKEHTHDSTSNAAQ